jgi:transcriptional regulator with XRE-family HTH domain
MGRLQRGQERARAASSGNRIREFREARGLRVDQLAEQLGIASSSLSRYETGARGLTVDTIRQVALVLGVPARDLLDEPDATSFASVRGRVQVNQDGYRVGVMLEPSETYLVAVPRNLPTDKAIDAFETPEGLLYCVELFPGPGDLEAEFVIFYETVHGGQNLSLRQLENDGGRLAFYAKEARLVERTIFTNDKRILRIWKVFAEYRELHGSLGDPRLTLTS